MPLRDRDSGNASDFVPAVFARSAEEARLYKELLIDNDIPAVVGSEGQSGLAQRRGGKRMTRGVPVLVPDSKLDKASQIIARQDELDEFQTQEKGLPGDLAAADDTVFADEDLEDDDDQDEDEDDEDFDDDLNETDEQDTDEDQDEEEEDEAEDEDLDDDLLEVDEEEEDNKEEDDEEEEDEEEDDDDWF
jgi:hypothetical protein